MKDIFHWVRLHLSSKINGCALDRLLAKYHSIEQAMQVYAEQKNIQLVPVSTVEKELEFCEQNNIHIITWTSDKYPNLLKQVSTAPILLWVKGNAELLTKNNLVSVVGSRNASLCGMKITKDIIQMLGKYNFVTVSGLAKGIDSIAHQESLHTGTIAVLGSGLNVIYPKSNQKLFQDIVEHGAIISELSHNTGPFAQYFPVRNRIIAGMTIGMIVIEAKVVSGSMLSAKYAVSYGRKIMAVPGSPLNERASGCLQLIKSGAMMIDNLCDIITYLHSDNRPSFAHGNTNEIYKSLAKTHSQIYHPIKHNHHTTASDNRHIQTNLNFKKNNTKDTTTNIKNHINKIDENQKMILDLISYSPVRIDHIIQITKLPTHIVQAIICKLIMNNKIIQDNDCVYLNPQ